ncbi:MAG: SURF1 family protein [Acidimicrobiia bacterium]
MYGFLVRPRWILGHTLAAAGIILFLAAGIWQLNRLSDRISNNEVIQARSAAPVVDLSVALRSVPAGSDPGAELEFRRVAVRGTYAPEHEILVRSRSLAGQAGYHVVTPLSYGDKAVLVNRGFVPQEFDEPPVGPALPPLGPVTVEGRIRASVDPPRIGPRDPSEGHLDQVFWLNIDRIQSQVPLDLVPVTIELVAQTPEPGALPVVLPQPPLDEGPHRGYAIQWFSFAAIAAAGYFFLIRRAARRPGER